MANTHTVIETHHLLRSQDYRHPLVNQYELISSLGEGMHGKVMLARNNTTSERVAIKVMKRVDPHNRRLPKSNRLGTPPMTAQQETESKIRREIAVMKKCAHQNLVQLREVIDDPASKKVYLVMENLAGGEVKWRNKAGTGPALEIGQVQRIMRDVTLGLEYLHHQGIIHRDIKPANLLWTADRQSVKICDFGVSHFAVAAAQQDPMLYDEAGLTKTAGSPAFFAPEICYIPPDLNLETHADSPPSASPASLLASPSQPPPITKQIDIWALGVTFYCLLFGTPPWQGPTEFVMFRSICTEDFVVPDTMAVERIPTGGRAHRPEGRGLGWCVVDLLEGLLEKDQDKRIKLADIKRIPWIQTGVRDPEKWLRETAPESQTPVTVTDEDTHRAIKIGRFFYGGDGFLSRIASGLRALRRSRGPSGAVSDTDTGPVEGPSNKAESIGQSGSSKRRSVAKRFTFGGSSSPASANSVPDSAKGRRDSSTGQHAQSLSDPSSQTDVDRTRGNVQHPASTSTSAPGTLARRPSGSQQRRPSESLQIPPGSAGTHRGFLSSKTSSSISPAPSPTTPDDIQPPGRQFVFTRLLTKVIHPTRADDESPRSRGRTSAETLDILQPREGEDLSGLTSTMRAASWDCNPTDTVVDDDGRPSSIDLTSSEAGGGDMQDFNKSVVRFGAGGYVDTPTAGAYQSLSTPGASGSGSGPATVSVSRHSDSSNSSGNTATPQPHTQYIDVAHHPPRVSSPLAHGHHPSDSDEEDGGEEDDLSSDVFEEQEGADSSEDEVLEVRTRRPSAILSRSADVSPLR